MAAADLRALGVRGKDAQRRRISGCVEAEDTARGVEWCVVEMAAADLRALGVHGKDAQRRRICRCVEAEDAAGGGEGRRDAVIISATHH